MRPFFFAKLLKPSGRRRSRHPFKEALQFLNPRFRQAGAGRATGKLPENAVGKEHAAVLIGDQNAGIHAFEDRSQIFHEQRLWKRSLVVNNQFTLI